jgi:hypothetical protein
MINSMSYWQNDTENGYIPQSVSGRNLSVVTTGAAGLSAARENLQLQNKNKWNVCIDNVLIEMGRHPQAYADIEEGILPPTHKAIATAIQFAHYARDRMWPSPGQILPDGEGGLHFQRAVLSGVIISFEARSDGRCWIWHYPRPPHPPVGREIELLGIEPFVTP